MIHKLKVWPIFFGPLKNGKKPWEVRFNDRRFGLGDFIILEEWCPRRKEYTGDALVASISYVVDLPGLDGYVGMTLEGLRPLMGALK